MTYLNYFQGFYRTAPATPGLLNRPVSILSITKFISIPLPQIYGPAIHHPTALTYAYSVLAQLGTATFTYGYWAHDLVGIMARCLENTLMYSPLPSLCGRTQYFV